MQTFLPYPDFAKSAYCLDDKRLGKQRVECLQIHNALTIGGGWQNHPAVRMWRGYECALLLYGAAIVAEWKSRGFKSKLNFITPVNPPTMPPWLGNPEFHASHRSNLLRKDFGWYSQFGWDEGPNLPYVWPV